MPKITLRMNNIFFIKNVKGRWVSLRIQLGSALFVPHSNHYKYWKDKLARVRGDMTAPECWELTPPIFLHDITRRSLLSRRRGLSAFCGSLRLRTIVN